MAGDAAVQLSRYTGGGGQSSIFVSVGRAQKIAPNDVASIRQSAAATATALPTLKVDVRGLHRQIVRFKNDASDSIRREQRLGGKLARESEEATTLTKVSSRERVPWEPCI